MPNTMEQIDKTAISYVCPECKKRMECDLAFIKTNKNTKLTKAHWCIHCGARHLIEYQINYKNKKTNLKVISFVSEDKVYKGKQFRKVEQPKKRKKK